MEQWINVSASLFLSLPSLPSKVGDTRIALYREIKSQRNIIGMIAPQPDILSVNPLYYVETLKWRKTYIKIIFINLVMWLALITKQGETMVSEVLSRGIIFYRPLSMEKGFTLESEEYSIIH